MSDFDPSTQVPESTPTTEVSVMPTLAQQVQQYSVNGYKIDQWDIRINKDRFFSEQPDRRVDHALCIEGVGYSYNSVANIEKLIAVLERVCKDARNMA